jgi:molybdopterin-binding protein
MRASIASPYVSATLAADPGEVVAVVGPNGAGKTTLLRVLAGLLPAAGTIDVNGRDVHGLPPMMRGVGWVPQERLLFEHLSALDNIAFGLRCRGVRRTDARRAAGEWLERLDIAALAPRRPAELSGGQAARVALARALAPQPALLLLDEPLAALDAESRDDVRRVLRSTVSGGPAAVLLVTHDPVDVVSLADRVLVMESGEVVQEGTPAELTAAPRGTWVAGLLGQNAWRGSTDATGLLVAGGGHITAAEPLPAGRAALALAEPSAVTLHRDRPTGSERNVLEGEITDVRALGGRVRLTLRGQPSVTAEITVAAAADLRLAEGGVLYAGIKATEVRLVDV